MKTRGLVILPTYLLCCRKYHQRYKFWFSLSDNRMIVASNKVAIWRFGGIVRRLLVWSVTINSRARNVMLFLYFYTLLFKCVSYVVNKYIVFERKTRGIFENRKILNSVLFPIPTGGKNAPFISPASVTHILIRNDSLISREYRTKNFL